MSNFLTDSWTDLEKVFGINGQTTADTSGMTPAQAKVASDAATIKNAGLITGIFGGISSAIGSYYAAKTAQYQEQSQASSLNFQANIDAINARQAEISAQSIEEAGKTQVQQYTMQAAQKNAATQVGTAARGIDLSSASAVEQRASDTLVKDIDTMTISANATRAAWAQRTQETNDDNEALLSRTGASNLLASSKTISPGFAATTSLLNSASSIAGNWSYQRKLQLAAAGAN
jgi:hypothetical protein